MNEIRIYGEIGDAEEGTTAKQVVDALAEMPDATDITVPINSDGGSVSQGVAIVNALAKHPAKIHTVIEGGAYSIAGYIACSGDTRTIEPNSLLHIHGPRLNTTGNLEDHEDSIEELKAATKQMGEHYARISGQDYDTIVGDFRRDRFFDADQAVQAGFMTQVGESRQVFAMRNYQKIKGIPRRFAAAWHAAENTDTKESSMAKATIKEMKAKFKGATADFLVTQVEAEATLESATAAYIKDLEATNTRLKTANASLKTEMEAMDDEESTAKAAKAMDDTAEGMDDLQALVNAAVLKALDGGDEVEAMDDDEVEAMDDEEVEASADEEVEASADEEITALRAQVAALKADRKKGRRRGKTGARAVRKSRSGAKKASAAAMVSQKVTALMTANTKLDRATATRRVYKDNPKLRERLVSEANA